MIFDTNSFYIEYYQPDINNPYKEFYISCNSEDMVAVFKKINWFDKYIEIAKINEATITKDDFDFYPNENYAQNAIEQLKEIFSDEEYAELIIKSAIIKYIETNNLNSYEEKHLNKIRKYFSFLSEKYLNYLLSKIEY